MSIEHQPRKPLRPGANQAVAWWQVHLVVAPLLNKIGEWPLIGTPEWCALDDRDPRKIAALYSAAEHWALKLELNQEAMAQASKDVSQAADWDAISRETAQRSAFYRERPWLRRKKAS